MNRRNILAAGLCGLALQLSPSISVAQTEPMTISVVKVISLSCPLSRESEQLDSSIRTAVEATGGRLAYAVMPVDPEFKGRELLYYGLRELNPARESIYRESLFKSTQDRGFEITDLTQLMVWFEQDLPDERIDYRRLAVAVNSSTIKDAYVRAVRVTVTSGVQTVPSYIVVTNDGIAGAFELSDGPNRFSDLRNSVLQLINQIQARNQ